MKPVFLLITLLLVIASVLGALLIEGALWIGRRLRTHRRVV